MSRKTDEWMPLYIARYHRDTTHLTTLEHGAYLLLIMDCWNRGGCLPADEKQLASIAKMTAPAFRKAWTTISPFFAESEGLLTNRKVVAELTKASRITEIRRESGKLGGRPAKPNLKANGSQTETPQEGQRPLPSEVTHPTDVQAATPSATQLAAAPDDWPDVEPRNMLAAFTKAVGSPMLDPSKTVAPKFHAEAPGYLRRWREAGCSWETDVLPVAVARAAVAGNRIQTLKYFDAAILDAHRSRTAEYVPATARPGDRRDRRLDDKLDNFARSANGARAALERESERGRSGFGGD